jgi:ABC-2 type transport system permease protein
VLRALPALAGAELRRYSSYRLAVWAGVITNSVFGLIRASVLLAAVHAAGGRLAGYDAGQASTYVWLGQGLLAAVAIWPWSEIADRVRTGDIAVDLARPVDLQLGWWARDLGRAAFLLPARGLPPLVVGALLVGVEPPGSWLAYPLGALSVLLAVSVSFHLRFVLNLVAFWTVDVRGYLSFYLVLVGPLSGVLVPVHVLPPWLRTVAYATPFPAMIQAPIDVLGGRVTGVEALPVLLAQAGWLVGLVLLGRLVMHRALRRLVVQGG